MTAPQPDFRQAMATVPGPVVIATTVDPLGRPWGFTASSFTSLSADPPLVLVCLDKKASTHRAFSTCDRFLVNVLSAEHAEVAQRFATSGTDRFAAADTRPLELGLPGLPDATARIACTLHSVLDGGDHSILVGRVVRTAVSQEPPLVYCRRGFTRLDPVPAAV
ncbi:flavin reductase family protein [Kitasatospora viridis]|uniref:Flavin reductase (DIM6/NTAB) family NADH-FMN oxidoreductase RutF n=1 Tax=Kitasatospora viridis TaxID=281105 RepID=A0A561SE99_9ACTN|nr:flavin reductase family protein [Kitasatospora viridis]TWF73165.1 flavin reductase (DIM6/NTAB) family NADH-FMN oxidoreductase RutF [Kitasatospora viridis]